MISGLLILMLAAHLMCVNVASAAPLVSLWLEWKEWRQRRRRSPSSSSPSDTGDQSLLPLAAVTNRYLTRWGLILLLVGGLLGVGIGILRWDAGLAEAVRAMPDKIKWAGPELVFSPALMIVYLIWLYKVPAAGRAQRFGRAMLPLLAGTNLLYHFPFLFTILASLAEQTDVQADSIDASVFRQLMVQGSVLAQVVHFLLASFAVTGVMLAGLALRQLKRQGPESPDARQLAAWSGWLGLVPTVLQIPVGLWLLMEQPAGVQRALMGNDPLGSVSLVLSILGAVALLHHFGALAMGRAQRPLLIRTMVLMTLIVLLMTAVLRLTHV